MGKKSREKKERQKRREMGVEEPSIKLEQEPEPLLFNIMRLVVYLTFLTPLILATRFYFPFVGPKSLYFMGCCQIVFFIWLYLAINYKRYRPKINLVLSALALFLIALILSSVLGVDFSRSFWSKYERMTGLLMWLHLLGFFLAISSTFRKHDWKKIFILSVSISFLISCFGILEYLKIDIFQFSDRGGVTFGNTSFLGTYILFNVFLSLYLFIKEKKLLILKILYSSTIFLGILTMYFQSARAALVSTIGGMGLIFLLWLSFEVKSKIIRNLSRVILALSIVVVLASIVLLYLPNNPIHDEFGKITTQSRFVNWEMAQKAFLERPLFGWGPENYTLIFTKFFNPCLFTPRCGSEIWFDRTHNIVLDTLSTTGILGFSAYLSLFFSSFIILGKKYFKEKSISFWTFSIFIAMLIAYFIQNLTVFDMTTSLMMFILVLGFISFLGMSRDRKDNKNEYIPKYPWIGGFLLIIFSSTFFIFVIQPLRADRFVIDALMVNSSQERVDFYEKAMNTSQLGKYQIRGFIGHHSGEVLRIDMEKISAEDTIRELDFVTGELEKTMEESPLDFRSAFDISNLYNFYSYINPEKIPLAEKYGEMAVKLSPTNQQGYWALAQTRVNQGNFEDALFLAQKAIEFEPEWFQSHQIAIQIAQIAGQQDLAIELLGNALKINPEWASEFQVPDTTPEETIVTSTEE